jgi:hypothetical protein
LIKFEQDESGASQTPVIFYETREELLSPVIVKSQSWERRSWKYPIDDAKVLLLNDYY